MLATIAVLALGLAPVGPPSKEALAAISERGRQLAAFDRAAWHGTDAVLALAPAPGAVQRYIAHKGDKGWIVAFGRLDKGRDKFLVTFEATEAGGPDRFEAKKVDPPRASTGFELRAALAIDAAQDDFYRSVPDRRPYNVLAIPAEGGRLWVYFVPAPTKPGVWPLGGDVRYLVDADGSKVVEKRQLHKTIIEVTSPRDDPEKKPVMGMHTHILTDVPEDTDVFHVLSREPARPEMVIAKDDLFLIKEDGSIEFAGKAKDVLKK
jgi:hypothetical protein